ncbi:aminoglycoside phosphotransferase family protein [Streptomyces sp. ISL-94]|uniref:aminoglycoside phosphotransferase family protein n=1 Tax=Streptomyces sp. ISL-94 TaxID=2819190 RepID=UPI001BEC252C|nr:aminoglycoside phosphotransferase family protein [Streptomyces sp. ISL-94]MBT2481861.1 aminoglycoside phosphotransferase family protein [Streptomyces sp. ISL-94]
MTTDDVAVDGVSVDSGGFDAVTPWRDPAWRAEALGWVEESLALRDLKRASGGQSLDVRVRPWSVVVRVPVENGPPVWFKANPKASVFEPALVRALHQWVPGQVLEPVAVSPERGWMLFPDGGELLGGRADEPAVWEQAMLQYAVLQRTVSAHQNELAGFGVPDLRPSVLAPVFGMLTHRIGGLDDGVHGALSQMSSRFGEWCAELNGSGIAATIDHSDLQEGQLFGHGTGRYVFHDWDAASLAFPFASLLVVARVIRRRFGADRAPAVLARIRDVYLEPWTDDGHSMEELRRLADLATRVSPVGQALRALTPGRMFPGTDADLRAMHSVGVQEGLAAACGVVLGR